MPTSVSELLAKHPLFGTLSDAHRQVMAEHAEVVSPEAGHYLLIAGKEADCFYVIESGALMIEQATSDGETTNIEQLGVNEIVGWSWLIAPYQWQFDALVVQPGRFWRFDGPALRAACAKDPAFGFELALRVTHTLVHRLQNTRIRLVEETAI